MNLFSREGRVGVVQVILGLISVICWNGVIGDLGDGVIALDKSIAGGVG